MSPNFQILRNELERVVSRGSTEKKSGIQAVSPFCRLSRGIRVEVSGEIQRETDGLNKIHRPIQVEGPIGGSEIVLPDSVIEAVTKMIDAPFRLEPAERGLSHGAEQIETIPAKTQVTMDGKNSSVPFGFLKPTNRMLGEDSVPIDVVIPEKLRFESEKRDLRAPEAKIQPPRQSPLRVDVDKLKVGKGQHILGSMTQRS